MLTHTLSSLADTSFYFVSLWRLISQSHSLPPLKACNPLRVMYAALQSRKLCKTLNTALYGIISRGRRQERNIKQPIMAAMTGVCLRTHNHAAVMYLMIAGCAVIAQTTARSRANVCDAGPSPSRHWATDKWYKTSHPLNIDSQLPGESRIVSHPSRVTTLNKWFAVAENHLKPAVI